MALPSSPTTMVNPPADTTNLLWLSTWTAWDSTEEEVVYELLKFFTDNAEWWGKTMGEELSVELLATRPWPGLTEEMVHPGALKFFKEKGIEIKLGYGGR